MSTASYEVFIDWDNDGGLDIGNFELTTESWAANNAGVAVALSTTQVHLGTNSLKVTWEGSAGTQVAKTLTGLTIGVSYTLSAWLFTPTGDVVCVMDVTGVASQSNVSVANTWTECEFTFTATATSHEVLVRGNTTPANTDICYMDQVMILSPGEDVSARALAGTALSFKYGRDQARSLAAIQPGETSFELNNRTKDYSPDNSSSPIFGKVKPGRPVLIRATFSGKSYDLFRGFIDDITVDPSINSRSVTISALDMLHKLNEATISTALYPSLQTGEVIGVILDAIGWPAAKRDIDHGATTARWWWEEGTNALEAVKKLVQSEGPPAFAFIDHAGNFIFRDRHHRLTHTASTTSQATFRDTGSEPLFSEPMTYEIGWKDLINQVTISVDEREATLQEVVFTTDDVINLAAGQTRDIQVQTSDPFYNANDLVADTDYILESGTLASVNLSRKSGQSTTITFTATTASQISHIQLRAIPVKVARTYIVTAQDTGSINDHGLHALQDSDLSLDWAGRYDAEAVAKVVLGLRAQRLPIVTITVKNGNSTRLTQELTRDLSDRVTIVEAQTGLNHTFFVEQITHSVDQGGKAHFVTFACERAQDQSASVFTFDVAGKGMDQGLFGNDGLEDTAALFVLGTGTLDNKVLGY